MRCDVLIVGAGQAGPPLAHALAKSGRTVVLAERKHMGGSCVNFGCTPTKAAIASAKLAYQARRAREYGVVIPDVEVDFAAVLARARKFAEGGRASLDKSFKGSENPKLIRSHARLVGSNDDGFHVDLDGHKIAARQIVLDTGTRSQFPPIEGLDEADVLHSENWLDQPDLPGHLAIIGGGYIGLEMAQFYRRMGSRVTVIETSSQIAGREDPDVSKRMQELLEAEGIAFFLEARAEKVKRSNNGFELAFRQKHGQEGVLHPSHIFVATGRKPNTDDLGLDTVNVCLDDQGYVQVDDKLATSVSGIWAAGDIRGGPMFTHTSWDDYRILESQLIGDGRRTRQRIEPYAIFTDPQLGRVGVTETQAREAGLSFATASFEMSSNGKAKEIGEAEGIIKVVVNRDDDTLLGATVLGAEGAELVHLYIDLMNAGASWKVIRDAVHIHPTLAEAAQSVFSGLEE